MRKPPTIDCSWKPVKSKKNSARSPFDGTGVQLGQIKNKGAVAFTVEGLLLWPDASPGVFRFLRQPKNAGERIYSRASRTAS
jgi:hypothetical protein